MIMLRKRQRRERVIVVLEGAKAARDDQKGIAALRWGLREIVDHKDDLLVLIILNPMDSIASPNVGFCCLGGDQPQHNILCGDKFIKFSHDQINERRQAYLQIYRPFYQRCKRFGVKFQVKVAVGKQPIEIMIEEANGFKATWIIVDRCFGGDKSLHGNFNIVLVNDDEEAEERKLLCTSDGLGKSKAKEVKLHPRSLEIFTEPELDFYPRSPKLLKEYVSQEEPHIRDSLQTSTKGERRSFHLSFLVNLTIESENQFNVEAPINENENDSKIKKPNDEIGDPMYFSNMSTMESENLVAINQLIKESDNLKAETSTDGLNYYTEQNVRKKILKDKKETRARSALDDHISFGRYSGAMIVLRQPSELSWEEIVEVTSGFRLEQCISKYDEFEMYDGYLMDPYVHSMIKKLNGDSLGVIEAEKRVACSLFHRNIVVLSAYHESAKATVLVYPMAEQGSLDKYLYDFRGEQVRLAFKNRMKIAIGVGRCLRYLHEECPRGPVVHANLQTCHIFLTRDFQPLVSGFERAIWLQFEQMVTGHSKSHEDTSQYESMELVKADVFSFGVLLLRLFCLRNLPEDNKQLVELARPLLRQGAFHELLDQDMEDLDMYEIYRVMSAAIQCTKKKPLSRPSMSQVVSILRGENLTVIESSPSSDGSVQGG